MASIKVVFLSSWHIGDKGKGDVNFVYDQIEAVSTPLDSYFFDYRFINLYNWLWLKICNKEVSKLTRLWKRNSVKAYTVFLPKFSTRFTGRSLYQDLEVVSGLFAKSIKKLIGIPDIVHIHTVMPSGIMGMKLKDVFNAKLVIHEHTGPFEMHLDTTEKRKFVERILNKADCLISVSHSLEKNIIEEFSNLNTKISVVPNLVRTDIFKVNSQKKTNSTLTIATVISEQPIKGLSILFEVAEILYNEYEVSFKWKLIGIDKDNGAVNSKIEEMGLMSCLEVLGKMTKEEIFVVYEKCDIYVCTSFQESFGLAPAESIASGVPVVSTKCGGPEMFMNENTGLWAIVGDPNDIANKVIDLNNSLNRFKPDAMQQWIESKFSADLYKDNILRIYNLL